MFGKLVMTFLHIWVKGLHAYTTVHSNNSGLRSRYILVTFDSLLMNMLL